MRPSRKDTYIRIAHLIALRGTCERNKVGCVITSKDHRIISTGYNGKLWAMGICPEHCDLTVPCTGAVHAEANAISSAAKHGISLEGSTLYCTDSPCLNCANLIIQAGITRVIYDRLYRITDGINQLKEHNIIVMEYGL